MVIVKFEIAYRYCQPQVLLGLSEREVMGQTIRDEINAAEDHRVYWPLHEPTLQFYVRDDQWCVEFGGKLYINCPDKITGWMALGQLEQKTHLLSQTLDRNFIVFDSRCSYC